MTTYTYTIIAPPGSISSSAESINDLGQIVGVRDSAVGFLYSNGVYTTVVPPGSSGAILKDINNSGQIIGWSDGGFLDTDGVFTTIRDFGRPMEDASAGMISAEPVAAHRHNGAPQRPRMPVPKTRQSKA